jgi:hypothetical protein
MPHALTTKSERPERTLRPDRIAIWPVEDNRFGVDVTYRGPDGYVRAEHVECTLRDSQVRTAFRQESDQAWTVRFGPVDREAKLTVLNAVVV